MCSGGRRFGMERKSDITLWLVITVCTLVIGSSMSCGYQFGIITGPSVFVKDFFNQTHLERHGTPMHPHDIALQWGGTVAVFCLGRVIGAFVGVRWSKRFGRSRSLLYNNAVSIVDSVLLVSCQAAGSPELVMFGRCIMGLSVGISMTVVPAYLAEVAPIRLRGSISKLHHVFFVSGILIGQFLGFFVFYGESIWPASLGMPALIDVVQTIFLLFVPESPRWLMHYSYAEEKAAGALRQLRRSEDVEQETRALRDEHRNECRIAQASVWEVIFLRDSNWKMPLLTCLLLQAGRQLSGVTAMTFYSSEVFELAGLSRDHIGLATLVWGVVYTAATIIEFFGPFSRRNRRPVMLVSYVVMATCMLGLSLSLVIKPYTSWLGWLGLVNVCLYFVAFALGPALTTSILCGELWSCGPRHAALNVTHHVRWWVDVLVQFLFPVLLALIGGYTLLIFTGCLIAVSTYLALYVPETRGRTFVEVPQGFGNTLKNECEDDDADEEDEKDEDDDNDDEDDDAEEDDIDNLENYVRLQQVDR